MEGVHLANLLVGTVIPLLVALVTKEVASSGVKGVLNAVLSAIGGALTVYVAAGGAVDVVGMAHAGIETFVVSIATYYGVYKATGLSTKVQAKTANVGVGGRNRLETREKQGPG